MSSDKPQPVECLSSYQAAAERQVLHLSRADRLEADDDPAAIELLALAADCQLILGSFSTGSGEGLASMAEFYRLLARQARLLERFGRPDEALAIWRRIAADPNGQGRFAESHIGPRVEKL